MKWRNDGGVNEKRDKEGKWGEAEEKWKMKRYGRRREIG